MESQTETLNKLIPDITIASISPSSEPSEPSYLEARPQTSSDIDPVDQAPVPPADGNARPSVRPSLPTLQTVVHYNHDDDVENGPQQVGELRVPRPKTRHKIKPYLLLMGFWGSGVAFSITHILYYKQQDGTIVGGSTEQEDKIRGGTAFAFLSQISLAAAVWEVYTQVVWNPDRIKLIPTRNDKTQGLSMTMETLNKIFGADRSILWLANLAMFKTFTAGYLIALFAWALILPGFFTPATIYVYDGVLSEVYPMGVPYLTIANATFGHNYSYSPDYWGDYPVNKLGPTKDFSGPRTILTLLTTAVSTGQILPIKPVFNISSYTVSFNGPSVRCFDADPETVSIIDTVRAKKMQEIWRGAKPSEIPYYAFVPSYDDAGNLIPLDTARYQTTANATNEIMLSFERYNLTKPGCQSRMHYQVCRLFNSTYHLNLEWSNGFQNITGTTSLISEEPVPFPMDRPPMVSDMVQHAYSAFFWALSDQVTGSFVWYEQDSVRNQSSGLAKSFGSIRSPIQHNVLLGCSDLNYYFDLNEEGEACRLDLDALNGQRKQDILLAGGPGRTLTSLIPEMAFNMTVSLLQHTGILTRETTRDVTVRKNVNRYGYSKQGLIIPYAVACVLSTCIVILGMVLMINFGPMPDREAQDIIAAIPPHLINIAKEEESHDQFRFGIQLEEEEGRGRNRRPSVVVQHQRRTRHTEHDSDEDTTNDMTMRQLHRQHGRRTEGQRL
ncbi:hypothetical protein QBC37DRAFT_116898 [Rhypophila decipiens]|uniref:Uncharacterized protein n=1 Tax=Rhypophila decipiens TaxID=261697 RepID=A0AAN6YAK4_9PEZI|nr:hypothetical protein QBC37DRAFT_116898 [Rhypophila decipiens]